VTSRARAATVTGLIVLIPAVLGAQTSGTADDSAAIVAASRALSAAYVASDTAALGRIYADTAVLLPRTARSGAAPRSSATSPGGRATGNSPMP
jgi:hypothetical protein